MIKNLRLLEPPRADPVITQTYLTTHHHNENGLGEQAGTIGVIRHQSPAFLRRRDDAIEHDHQEVQKQNSVIQRGWPRLQYHGISSEEAHTVRTRAAQM